MSAERRMFYLQLVDEEFRDIPCKAGSIWFTNERDINIVFEILLQLCKSKPEETDIVVSVSRNFLLDVSRFATISLDEYELLIPVNVDKRLQIYYDRDWLREGLAMKTDSRVVVTQDKSSMTGVVRYVGVITVGRMFGIELDREFHGQGTCNGKFRRKQYFECEDDCAVFHNLYRLRLEHPKSVSLSHSLSENWQSVEHRSYEDQGTSVKVVSEHVNYPLSVAERVVWMSDEGPEFGTVKWIGCLPDATINETTVGVEFDNPIGSGTGRYKSHRLFTARRNHASLVPILGLMKMSDYMPESAESPFGVLASNFPGGNPSSVQESSLENTGRSVPREVGNIDLVSQEIEKLGLRARQSPTIRGRVMPPSITADAVDSLCGKEKGLQGQSYACGLESVIYALFAFSSCLDGMLYEDQMIRKDLVLTIKSVLVEHIVNPLRAVNYVSCDRISRYKELVSLIGQPDVCNFASPSTDDMESNLGRQDDPSVAVRQILSDLLGVRSQFSSLQDTADYVLRISEFDRSSVIESLQHALERTQFSSSRQQAMQFPFPVLVVEVNRDESSPTTVGLIYPDPIIDISHAVAGFPKSCKICGRDANLQCWDCFSKLSSDLSQLSDATFCYSCYEMFHQHINRKKHLSMKLHQGVYAPEIFKLQTAKMEIFAIVSHIRGHFVSFVRSGSEPDSPWLFYDGMAKRAIVDGQGVFISEVRQCHEIGKCLIDCRKFLTTPFGTHSELVQCMMIGLRLCFYRPLHSERRS